MGTPTLTPNIGLQVPGFNTPNWNVPIIYDLNLLDAILGGTISPNPMATTIAALTTAEELAGDMPGTTFTLSKQPTTIFGLFWNGIFQRPNVDYTVNGAIITTTFTPSSGDILYAVYIHT